jgi:7-cyano-7-deazaguanine reductase
MSPANASLENTSPAAAEGASDGTRGPGAPAAGPGAGQGTQATISPRYGEREIAEAKLICFDNPRPARPYEVSIELPEFTCSCPFSGYPDFAVLRLLYQPGPRVLELKALKLYMNSYRDRAISHEEVANRILDDLVAAADPVWMELLADFNPRGNVHTKVRVSHGSRRPC